MTNVVAAQYGWHTGSNLVPSQYLCVEQTQDQIDLLNPTPRDVQLGAIIDQCSGKSAKKVIAKRRVNFVTGNINSYARVLNGPAQIEKIKTFNQLTTSIAELRRDRDEKYDAAIAEKKKRDEEKQKSTRPFWTYRGMRFTRSQIYLLFDVSAIPKLTISSIRVWSLANACEVRLKSPFSCHYCKRIYVELRFIAKFQLC